MGKFFKITLWNEWNKIVNILKKNYFSISTTKSLKITSTYKIKYLILKVLIRK